MAAFEFNPKLNAAFQNKLTRDDETDPNGRIYRNEDGEIFHSVTRILGATSQNKDALEAWKKRLGEEVAAVERDTAAERGTRTHNSAEYVLRTAKKLAEATSERKHSTYMSREGLHCTPAPLTQWAIKQALPSAPKVGLSASGYQRSLLQWIEQHVTAIHGIEFSIHHPAGFAGTADFLGYIKGKGPYICDWKTSANKRSEEMLTDYCDQLGAYSLGLKHVANVRAKGAVIVVARRAGPAQVRELTELELRGAECRYLERCEQYYDQLQADLRSESL
jgi:genome maintenance exonuclease 1